jgi:hypothetical protein
LRFAVPAMAFEGDETRKLVRMEFPGLLPNDNHAFDDREDVVRCLQNNGVRRTIQFEQSNIGVKIKKLATT